MRRRSYPATIAGGGLVFLTGCAGGLNGERTTIHAPERATIDKRLDFTMTDVTAEELIWIE